MEIDNLVKRCTSVTVESRVPRSTSRKTWGEVPRAKGLNREAATDCAA